MSDMPSSAIDRPANPRILIVGNAGQLGRELEKIFLPASAPSLVSIANPSISPMPGKPATLVRRAEPDIILNAAAYTAVDRAETERDLAYAINEQAPRVLAEEAAPAQRPNRPLLHRLHLRRRQNRAQIYPWIETDVPNPLNVYGASKLAGEQAVEKHRRQVPHLPHQLGLRPPRQQFSPHHASPGARARPPLHRRRPDRRAHDVNRARPRHALDRHRHPRRPFRRGPKDWTGLYHMTCGGSVSWFGFRPGHLRPRRPAPRPQTTNSHPHRHQQTIPPLPRVPATPCSQTPNSRPASAYKLRRGNRPLKKPSRP
jgi:dTDP-4-dehydrorhamnose reductase